MINRLSAPTFRTLNKNVNESIQRSAWEMAEAEIGGRKQRIERRDRIDSDVIDSAVFSSDRRQRAPTSRQETQELLNCEQQDTRGRCSGESGCLSGDRRTVSSYSPLPLSMSSVQRLCQAAAHNGTPSLTVDLPSDGSHPSTLQTTVRGP